MLFVYICGGILPLVQNDKRHDGEDGRRAVHAALEWLWPHTTLGARDVARMTPARQCLPYEEEVLSYELRNSRAKAVGRNVEHRMGVGRRLARSPRRSSIIILVGPSSHELLIRGLRCRSPPPKRRGIGSKLGAVYVTNCITGNATAYRKTLGSSRSRGRGHYLRHVIYQISHAADHFARA